MPLAIVLRMASTTVEVIRSKFEALKPVMDERTRRLWAATEAKAIGRGGITRVSQATGSSHVTIRAGLSQLGQPPEPDATTSRVRRPGGERRDQSGDDPAGGGLVAEEGTREGERRDEAAEGRLGRQLYATGPSRNHGKCSAVALSCSPTSASAPAGRGAPPCRLVSRPGCVGR